MENSVAVKYVCCFSNFDMCFTDFTYSNVLMYVQVCSKCGMLSNSEEDFTLLMFNIPHREQVVAATLEDCLDHIVEENVHDSLSRCER